MAGKVNILAAKESSCPICGGTTYKIKLPIDRKVRKDE